MRLHTLITIDPGYAKAGQGCAVACFEGGSLTWVGFARPEKMVQPPRGGVDLIVWECPQVDARTLGRAEAAVQLAAVGGTLAGIYSGANYCAKVEQAPPRAWKGAVAKPVQHGRMWQVLTEAEQALLGGDKTAKIIQAAKERGAAERWKPGVSYYPRTWLIHNLLDAVGIGLWRLGRISK